MIAIVEDDEFFRASMRRLMRSLGALKPQPPLLRPLLVRSPAKPNYWRCCNQIRQQAIICWRGKNERVILRLIYAAIAIVAISNTLGHRLHERGCHDAEQLFLDRRN
jgi:hypothetical protein